MGVTFGKPQIDLEAIRAWKGKVVDKLADGLVRLSQKRGVAVVHGAAVLEGSDRARVIDSESGEIRFRHAILATGSHPRPIPGAEFRPGGRMMDSAGALDLVDIPETLLVVGGGYIALELGSVYASLGSRVTVVVRSERLLRGSDADLVSRVGRRLEQIFEAIRFNTRVTSLKEMEDRVEVAFDGEIDQPRQTFDRVLVAVGREPRSRNLGLEKTGVKVSEKGFVVVDQQRRTANQQIFAVGDVTGEPMLAHKAMFEGRVAAEVIAGQSSAFDPQAIPAVVYTDPQIAWCGLTEEEAETRGRSVEVVRFPWKLSGRAVTMDAREGLTKMIIDPETGRILGVGVVGRNAEGLIAEGVLAIEMGALAEDVALTIHPHPTLSETAGEAAELFLGSATHILSKPD
jgi:dihydrolipoamide dehydrogenase